ncbi:hypothetical protein I546_1708 [Mycobacterium kansasii 732]|nr:hypothetical protein I546_1708 [Mycobacterium kansasii 732]
MSFKLTYRRAENRAKMCRKQSPASGAAQEDIVDQQHSWSGQP